MDIGVKPQCIDLEVDIKFRQRNTHLLWREVKGGIPHKSKLAGLRADIVEDWWLGMREPAAVRNMFSC
jgi:hypothetical protein